MCRNEKQAQTDMAEQNEQEYFSEETATFGDRVAAARRSPAPLRNIPVRRLRSSTNKPSLTMIRPHPVGRRVDADQDRPLGTDFELLAFGFTHTVGVLTACSWS